MPERKYYEAYDDRYRQVHEENLQWFHKNPSAIVAETMSAFSVSSRDKILEIGCGEGRDAFPLLEQGFDLLATDVSPEAIRFCQSERPDFAKHFQTLDCVSETLGCKFDFIYAVAVVHMLVPDEDRNAFYGFIRAHLKSTGIALVCTMGDGSCERRTDIHTAFDRQERVHEQTGKTVRIAGTSCRMVSFRTFEQELERNGLVVIKRGVTSVEPDFSQMMYAVVRMR
ncbi:MAG: class I SAM-dependent methyltransferase [Oscillospiraceae bacterium]